MGIARLLSGMTIEASVSGPLNRFTVPSMSSLPWSGPQIQRESYSRDSHGTVAAVGTCCLAEAGSTWDSS